MKKEKLFLYPAVFIKNHPFFFQKSSLPIFCSGGRMLRQAAVLPYDPVPGHLIRAYMECPAHLAGHAGTAGQSGHLPVAHHTSPWDCVYDLIDLFKKIHEIIHLCFSI